MTGHSTVLYTTTLAHVLCSNYSEIMPILLKDIQYSTVYTSFCTILCTRPTLYPGVVLELTCIDVLYLYEYWPYKLLINISSPIIILLHLIVQHISEGLFN